jgi:hypothetical protein
MSQFGTLKRTRAYTVICKDGYSKAVTTTSAHQLEARGETIRIGDIKFKFDSVINILMTFVFFWDTEPRNWVIDARRFETA